MIFYLGDIVKGVVKDQTRLAKNKLKKWDYGYNEEIDTIIISKDGTLGEIYDLQGIKVGLPQKPKDEEIINHEKPEFKQKWKREEMPKGLDEETMMESRFDEYIDDQYLKRERGIWIYIKGNPIYIPGTYWFGLQWCRESSSYPAFRIIQNELMIFWEACKADQRSYGMDYVKNRRFGASLLSIIEQLDSGTVAEDKLLGIISKKGDDSRKIFRRLVKIFLRLPCFFRPVWSGTNMPKTELVLEEPTKRKSKGEKVTEGSGLGTIISWHSTDLNAMDGDEIFRSLLDESGKYPKEVPIDDYWPIVKTSHRKGSNIVGKCMMVSTVNSSKKGGAEFKSIWDDSNPEERNQNGQTISGLYRVFIPAEYGLEGFYDEYGYSIVQDPEKPIKNDLGQYIKIGADTYLNNEAEALENNPEKLNEFKRQFPRNIRDAFRDESSDCDFNVIKLQEQIDHNEYELDEEWGKKKEFVINKDLERGNFIWKDGIKDTEVIWVPDPVSGRFYIRKGCHPPREYRNAYEEKYKNGVLAKSPLAGHIGAGGIDPYNRSKTADGRGSNGSYHLTTGAHTCDELPNDTCIVEYIARPKKVEIFFEDMIMVSVYYSMPFLCELSNERFLIMVKDRGYRHYSMNNPLKKSFNDLNPTEKDLGGAPQQDSKIGDAQFYAVESFVEDHLGVARDVRHRKLGEMGNFPFSRTLYQLKEVDTEKRTKYDAYISFSLSRLANQKRPKKKQQEKRTYGNPFEMFDNSGVQSKTITQ